MRKETEFQGHKFCVFAKTNYVKFGYIIFFFLIIIHLI